MLYSVYSVYVGTYKHTHMHRQISKGYMCIRKSLRLTSNVYFSEGYVWRGEDLFISYSPEYGLSS